MQTLDNDDNRLEPEVDMEPIDEMDEEPVMFWLSQDDINALLNGEEIDVEAHKVPYEKPVKITREERIERAKRRFI